MKSESGLSLAIASQPYKGLKFLDFWLDSWLWVGAICQYCFKQDQCQNDDRMSFCLKGVTPLWKFMLLVQSNFYMVQSWKRRLRRHWEKANTFVFADHSVLSKTPNLFICMFSIFAHNLTLFSSNKSEFWGGALPCKYLIKFENEWLGT